MTLRYKLLMGGVDDFDGANHDDTHAFVHNEYGWVTFTNNPKTVNRDLFTLVAHREPIANEKDLDECICAPEADAKRGEFVPNTTSVGNLNPEPSIMGVPLRKIDGAETVNYPGIDAIITERGSRYGKFKDGAQIMQELKDVMREVDGWHNLTPSQREALDMIQHKIGRILNGDPTYDDSWKDIAVYATLIVNELNGEIK